MAINIDPGVYQATDNEMLDYLIGIASSLGENEEKEIPIWYQYHDYMVVAKAESLSIFPMNNWCPKCAGAKVREGEVDCYRCNKRKKSY